MKEAPKYNKRLCADCDHKVLKFSAGGYSVDRIIEYIYDEEVGSYCNWYKCMRCGEEGAFAGQEVRKRLDGLYDFIGDSGRVHSRKQISIFVRSRRSRITNK